MCFLRRAELGLLATQPALGLATFMPSRVRARIRSASNSATMARTLNSSRPTGSVGSCKEPPRLSLTWRPVSSSTIVARVGQRACEPIELGDHELVAGAAGGERVSEARPRPAGAGESVVDVDALGVDAERLQRVAPHARQRPGQRPLDELRGTRDLTRSRDRRSMAPTVLGLSRGPGTTRPPITAQSGSPRRGAHVLITG